MFLHINKKNSLFCEGENSRILYYIKIMLYKQKCNIHVYFSENHSIGYGQNKNAGTIRLYILGK